MVCVHALTRECVRAHACTLALAPHSPTPSCTSPATRRSLATAGEPTINALRHHLPLALTHAAAALSCQDPRAHTHAWAPVHLNAGKCRVALTPHAHAYTCWNAPVRPGTRPCRVALTPHATPRLHTRERAHERTRSHTKPTWTSWSAALRAPVCERAVQAFPRAPGVRAQTTSVHSHGSGHTGSPHSRTRSHAPVSHEPLSRSTVDQAHDTYPSYQPGPTGQTTDPAHPGPHALIWAEPPWATTRPMAGSGQARPSPSTQPTHKP